MQLLPRLFALLLLGTAVLRGGDSLAHARLAQTQLGAEVWSRVIRVENVARASRYPRVVYALVFELAGLLWFYTDTDGTQSFSLHKNRLAGEKADFAPLLRDIEPGFVRWSELSDADHSKLATSRTMLPNGCFIESVVALRERFAQGEQVENPQLLSFYVDTPEGVRGHTVLTYRTRDRVEIIDPQRSPSPLGLSSASSNDAMALARASRDGPVARARLLPLAQPAVERLVAAPGQGGAWAASGG